MRRASNPTGTRSWVIAIALAMTFGPAAPAPAAAKKTYVYKGKASYLLRSCHQATDRRARPVAGATIVFRTLKGADVGRTRVAADGSFSRTVKTKKKPADLDVWLHLKNPGTVTVARRAGTLGTGYEFHLGRIRAGAGVTPFALSDDHRSGAANIFVNVHRIAKLTRDRLGVPIRPLMTYWSDGTRFPGPDLGGTFFEDGALFVDGDQDHHEWEPFAMAHEYGHYVQSLVAPDREPTDAHDMRLAYPDNPDLAWSEGFANAFGAIAGGSPKFSLNCLRGIQRIDLAPAAPTVNGVSVPADRAHAQFNEAAVAGVLWDLSKQYGTTPVAGFKRLLAAMSAYSRAHGGPYSLRTFRDALIVGGLERTLEEHNTLEWIFRDRYMGWGLAVNIVQSDPRDAGSATYQNLSLRMTGIASGECRVTDDDPNTVLGREYSDGYWANGWFFDGGIPYAWQDDCFVHSEDGDPLDDWGWGHWGHIALRLPYEADQSHSSPTPERLAPSQFVISAQWTCVDDPDVDDPPSPSSFCTSARQFEVTVWDPLYNVHVVEGVMIGKNEEIEIARFDWIGHCRITIMPAAKCPA